MKLLIIAIALFLAFLLSIHIVNINSETGFSEENYIKPTTFGTTPNLTSVNPGIALNVSGDKRVYHSSEEMELETTVKTDTELENLTIRVYGIKDNRGSYRINRERVVDVDPPGTSETFVFKMPSCYGCAGVSPGEYDIVMEILQDNEVIRNQSVTVKLEK